MGDKFFKNCYKLIVKSINFIIKISPFWLLGDEFIIALKGRVRVIRHGVYEYYFSCPTRIANYRARTFVTKEPLTLKWIDEMSKDSILWDIGANVGLYSIYAAKTKGIKVLSFEPSIFNLELLAKNICLNNLTDLVSIIPLPLYSQTGFNSMTLSSEYIGAALNTFGETYGQDGKKLKTALKYSVLGISIDDFVGKLQLPMPTHIKIDVDGIEHLILSGGVSTLKNVQSILIEVNDNFIEQAESVRSTLNALNFYLRDKHVLVNNTLAVHANQLWIRRM